jgi:hypothetical protein
LLITSSRLLVIEDGVSVVKYKNILNISVDYYKNMIFITKDKGTYPVYIQCSDVFRSYRALDLAYKEFLDISN